MSTDKYDFLFLQVDVPIISNSECQRQFSQSMGESIYPEEDIWVCAGYSEGGKDACDVSCLHFYCLVMLMMSG